MLRLYPSEEFREIKFEVKLKLRYAISNIGRLISFKDDIRQGTVKKPRNNHGSLAFQVKAKEDGKYVYETYSYSKLVATYFIPKTSEEQVQVIHLDYDVLNNRVPNLRWATYEEKLQHQRKSPHVLAARKKLIEHNIKSDGRKLTVTKVMLLKKRLLDPNRKTRMKMLAKQFGVSEMQLYRIKSGENWGHIKV